MLANKNCDRNVTHKDVLEARSLLGGSVRTPLAVVEGILVKQENLQGTGVFKIRGVMNMLRHLNCKPRGLITASTGNHGLCVAAVAKELGIPAVVVVPETIVTIKRSKIKGKGAEVVIHGYEYDEQEAMAKRLASERDFLYVPTADHPEIIAGQGTCALEIMEEAQNVETILAPVGNGGLIAGIGVAVKEGVNSSNNISVIGVQSECAPSMYASLSAGEIKTVVRSKTIADGIAIRRPASLPFEVARRLGLSVKLVSDGEIINAMAVLKRNGITAEPAGAVAFAEVLKDRDHYGPDTCAVISGGNASSEMPTP